MHEPSHEALSLPSPPLFSTSVASMLLTTLPLSITSSALRPSMLPTPTSASFVNSTFGNSTTAGVENGECRLLGPFALFIQGALGLLALLSLVYKRWRERPQRPIKIWAFDASKQVVGSALLHVANLFMSMVSSGELKPKAGDFQANPCSFYLLNLAIDTTIGIPILIVLLRVLTHAFSLTPLGDPPESIQSGNYGRPPRTKWWLKQCLIYFLGLLGMKFCVYFIFQICPWIITVGDWALRWTEGNETLQVFFVMLFFPLVMNAIQYYIIDSFIKDRKPEGHEGEASDDGNGTADEADGLVGGRPSADSDHGNGLDGADEAQAIKEGADPTASEDAKGPPLNDKLKGSTGDDRHLDEYDPTFDSEASSPTTKGTPGKAPKARGGEEAIKASN